MAKKKTKKEVIVNTKSLTGLTDKPLTDNEWLFKAIDYAIEVADEIMAKDRSRVLRLKGLVTRLNDAKKIIK